MLGVNKHAAGVLRLLMILCNVASLGRSMKRLVGVGGGEEGAGGMNRMGGQGIEGVQGQKAGKMGRRGGEGTAMLGGGVVGGFRGRESVAAELCHREQESRAVGHDMRDSQLSPRFPVA